MENKGLIILATVLIIIFFIEGLVLPEDFMIDERWAIPLMLFVFLLFLLMGFVTVLAGVINAKQNTNFYFSIKIIIIGLTIISLFLFLLFSVGYPGATLSKVLEKIVEFFTKIGSFL